MAKRKWNKPTMAEIRKELQFFLLEVMTAIGFSTVYMNILLSAGVPQGLRVAAIAAILGVLSKFGLFCWIGRD